MLKKYLVTKMSKEEIQSKTVLSALELNDYQAIVCSDWDPFNPFADYNVNLVDEFPLEKFFEYGGSIKGIIYDEEQIERKDIIIKQIKKAGGM